MTSNSDDVAGDAHVNARVRFHSAFGTVGDAVLVAESGEVLEVLGPLAASVARVGALLTDLPSGVVSDDLVAGMSAVMTAGAAAVSVHLLVAGASAVTMRVFGVLSEDGTSLYLVGVLSPDIAANELDRLRRNDRVYELWFERAPTGVCLVATDGTFLRANPACCRLVGRSESELRTLTFQDITHPDDVLLDVSSLEDVLAGRADRYEMDKRYIRPDGSIVWVHLTVALLLDEAEQPLHFISMLEDITDRRNAQERLTATLERLTATLELWRTMFEFTPLATAELDLNGVIIRANAAAGRLMGCDPDELVGLGAVELGVTGTTTQTSRNLARLASGEMASSVTERRFTDRAGRERWLLAHTAAVAGPAGVVDRLVIQVVDVTEGRVLRERLQRSVDELSVAYREKAALMTALSHDLRTPLATIRILAELLVSGDPTATDSSAPDLARRLLAESARTEGVLGDLVSSERASAGSITPRRVQISLNTLVRRVVDIEADERSSHDIVLRLADDEHTMWADPALVERMVANLISNAIRHTRAGTTIWVIVDAEVASGNGSTRIVVEDDGAGVPDNLKEAIFEPYVRGAPADRPGSGIGLFLVRRFAEFHGGTVDCTDRVGGGARFQVTLPLR